MRHFFIILALFPMLAAGLGAEPSSSLVPRGLVIYKKHAFLPDSSAVLFEYLSHEDHPAVIYFVTAGGVRITAPLKKSEVWFLPFPRRGEATPAEALAMLDIARNRFPQFQSHYPQLESSWRREALRPPGEIAAEIEQQKANMDTARTVSAWLRSLFPQPSPLKIPPALLQPATLHPEKANKEPDSDKQKSDDSSDLAESLKRLQEGLTD